VNSVVAWLRGPQKYFYLMKAADHVITCTPYLDSFVRKYNSRTTDISSTIDTDKYVPIYDYSNDRPIVLGWSGSHSTVPYLHLLDRALRELRKQYEFKLLVFGTSTFEMDGIEVEAIPWKEATEVRDLKRIDIGLYPLPDEEWVLGKSGLKALQYMALGIPTVATAVGANFRVIEDGVSGFLVKSEEEWKTRLGELLNDADLRRRLGRRARERVEQHYSLQANAPTYLRIFKEVF
jgi:glycosyltransferase involved in cell wall biosynthesis